MIRSDGSGAAPNGTPDGASVAVVACRAVTRTYHLAGSDVGALRGVNLDIEAGRFTALVGPSGSGKSTLLRLLACVDRPDAGTITIDGVEVGGLSRRSRVRLRRHRLGVLAQAPADNLVDYLTVRQHVRLAARLRGRRPDPASEADLLTRLGLADRADHVPRQLSGGEQQRAAIAFASVGAPVLLAADEPTGQLDHSTVDSVVDGFLAMAAAGMAVVAATHDPMVAARAHRVVRMRDGMIEEAAS